MNTQKAKANISIDAGEPPALPDSRVRTALREWLTQARKHSFDYEIKDDTQIIEQRIITSIQVMDLLLFIEGLTGRPIEIEQVRPASFRDINSICNAFFEATQ